MHWFNTASVDSKQRYAKQILGNISRFQDLLYYGFISIKRLEKLVAQARKHLTPEACEQLPAVLVSKTPRGSLDQAEAYARILADTADWPFYFFGDEDDAEEYWGLTQLEQLKTKEKIRQEAQQEIENAKYYRALCYYGFMTPEKALQLLKQFKKLLGDESKTLEFPEQLDSRYLSVVSFDEAYCYAQTKAAKTDWHFYTAVQRQDTAGYWGLHRYEQLKKDYECHSGVGDFFGFLFIASGLSFFSQPLHFSMNSFSHQMAKRKVAEWCWSHRALFVSCTHVSQAARMPLIRDAEWVERLLVASAQLAEPQLSEKSIRRLIQREHEGTLSFENLYLIKFLDRVRQSNEAILNIVEKNDVLYKQYRGFSAKKRAFLQDKVSLENYFDRSQISVTRPLS